MFFKYAKGNLFINIFQKCGIKHPLIIVKVGEFQCPMELQWIHFFILRYLDIGIFFFKKIIPIQSKVIYDSQTIIPLKSEELQLTLI